MRYKDLKTDTWKLDSIRVKGVVRMCVCVCVLYVGSAHAHLCRLEFNVRLSFFIILCLSF